MKKNSENVVVTKEEKKRLKQEEKAVRKAERLKLKEQKKAIKKSVNNDKKVIIAIVAFVLIIALGIFGFYFYKASFEVIATFDGGKVTKAEYDVYYKTFANILSQYYGYEESVIPGEIAKKAAVDKVIVGLAKKAGTQISEDDQAQLDEIFNNDDYVQSFVSQGMDIGKTRELYYNDYLITQYLEDLKENASDEDILAFIKENEEKDIDLNEYNTSHILFKTTDEEGKKLADDKKNEVRQKAEAILQRALAGEDFATLAKDNSEDTGTASDGGKYVCYDDGSTTTEYINAVKAMEVGKVNQTLIETSYGFHIIKLNEKIENGRVKSSSERENYVNSFTDGIEEKYNVVINDEVLNKYIIAVTGNQIPSDDEETSDEKKEETSTEDVKTTEETTQE